MKFSKGIIQETRELVKQTKKDLVIVGKNIQLKLNKLEI